MAFVKNSCQQQKKEEINESFYSYNKVAVV